jgi:pyruvate/2-oxoglutarate dehydrogenase complex dihydrolipoamide dehydrogenase (E3) component
MYDITLVGFGPAHMALLLAISHTDPTLKVAIIDPYFDGGSLMRDWSTVQSNTTWQQFLDAIRPYCSESRHDALRAAWPATATTPLGSLVRSLAAVVASSTTGMQIDRFYGLAEAAAYEAGTWTVSVSSGGTKVQSQKLSLAQGAKPRQLAYPKPQLPLASVLGPGLLSKVLPGERVLVFGLSHSGTLAVDALLKVGATVEAVYATDRPFLYERDGVYGGIKQESADIADYIQTEGKVKLIHLCNTDALMSAVIRADWVVYAVGFAAAPGLTLSVDGALAHFHYDSETGVGMLPNTFGWGIAYPSSTIIADQKHFDVGIAAFIKHAEHNVSRVIQKPH